MTLCNNHFDSDSAPMQVLKYQLELSQLKQEVERRLAEKDEESEAIR